MGENFKNILIRGVNWIGDAVLTIPAIKSVRIAFPDAHISLLVKPQVADIFIGNPDINDIILYDKKFDGFTGKFKLARILKARGFNIAILLQNAFDAALISWLAGIPERIGYSRDYRKALLTKPVPVKKETPKQHQVYYYLDLIKEAFNIEPEDTDPFIYLDETESHDARKFLAGSFNIDSEAPTIGINPGATYGSAKRWEPKRFAELIHKIIDGLKAKVIIFGSESEVKIAEEIISGYPPSVTRHILNMAGKTSLRLLASLLSECDMFITNDSGPMHMASALSVPVIAIFGSTDSKETGPFGEGHKVVDKMVSCSPCLKRECPEDHHQCMTEISTDDVFNALKELLPKEKAVFLDRDGTIIEDVGYLNSFKDLKIFKDSLTSLERLKKAGFKLIGITNQSGIARGLTSEEFVWASNTYIQKTLGMDDFFYCPHHPDKGCLCRKPKPLLMRKARLKHRLDLKKSYVIGDKTIDIMLAKTVGAKGILVLTGHDKESEIADFIAKNLTEAVDWILKDSKQ